MQATAAAFVAAQAAKGETIATRKASQQAIEAYAELLPEMIGGSADLTGSVFTNWSGSKRRRRASAPGNYVYFGVREFGMSAIANGLALHGGFIPYVGTFLTFSDYARNALRMAALMKLRTIFVFTHDSIGLGEDGPTHQSVEHAASLRLIPGMDVWRPCDTVETAVAWAAALERADGPTVPAVHAPERAVRAARRRADRRRSRAAATCSPISTRRRPARARSCSRPGSEVALALGARDALAKDGVAVRVVSMPCTSVFDRQDAAYRESVLPRGVPRVAVEAGVTDFWRTIRRRARRSARARSSASTRFGESAPAPVLFKHFGFTADASWRRSRRAGEGRKAVKASSLEREARILAGRARTRDRDDPPRHARRRAAIAQVRVDAWRTTYRGLIPDAYLAAMTVEDSTALWDTRARRGAEQDQHVRRRDRRRRRRLRLGHDARRAEARLRCRTRPAIYLARDAQRAGIGTPPRGRGRGRAARARRRPA